jgi:hypothetical protein
MAKTIIPDIFEHDIGTHFVADIKNLINAEDPATLDISSAEEKLIIFIKPDSTETEMLATFVTNGTDGLLEYITANEDDLVMVGTDPFEQWEYYAWVKYNGGQRRTSTVKFKLYKGRASQIGS